ncbi:MAG: hypothetical protein NZM25_03880 [Leptospiraceae bacterium]|nr:hypothetical protein [Leptospiraceae bacterium]MDW8306125.1 hypothetical protein [Leptospiraceae bacterium]
MLYQWGYLKEPNKDYSESYHLRTIQGDTLRVEVNRPAGLVRITLTTYDGQRFQSTMSHGVILREMNLSQNLPQDLEEIFSRYRFELSSLPDNQVLRLIGGNYGVLSQFLGKRRDVYEILPSGPVTWQEWLKSLKEKFRGYIKEKLRLARALFFYPPQTSDVWDALLLTLAGGYAYQINYSYLDGGFFLAAASLLNGLVDYFLKKRSPYLPKVILFFLAGFGAIAWGWYYE